MVKLNIGKKETLKIAFFRIFNNLLDYSENCLKSGEKQDIIIHEARKSFKRLRSLLKIYRLAIDDDIYNEINILIRDSGRKLSHFRDIDAIAECLHKITPKNEPKHYLIEQLTLQVESLRMNYDIREIDNVITSVFDDINAIRELLAKIILPDELKTVTKKGIRKIYNNSRTLYYKNMIDMNDILMHEWRKRVKQLWDVSLFFNSGDEIDYNYAESIHLLSTYLGDYHDLVITFDFVYDEKLILEQENLIKFKKILFKLKDKISRKAFNHAANIYKFNKDEYTKQFLNNFNKKR